MWQVYITQRPGMFLKDIFIYRKYDSKTEIVRSGPDGMTIEQGQEGSMIKPTISLDEEQFTSLVNAVHKDYKPSEGKFTEGKLEGTERHLQDLRVLLKLK